MPVATVWFFIKINCPKLIFIFTVLNNSLYNCDEKQWTCIENFLKIFSEKRFLAFLKYFQKVFEESYIECWQGSQGIWDPFKLRDLAEICCWEIISGNRAYYRSCCYKYVCFRRNSLWGTLPGKGNMNSPVSCILRSIDASYYLCLIYMNFPGSL